MAGRPSFAQLIQRLVSQQTSKAGASATGGKGAPNLGQALGGGAGVIALAAGGLALNSAIFNGQSCRTFSPGGSYSVIVYDQIGTVSSGSDSE